MIETAKPHDHTYSALVVACCVIDAIVSLAAFHDGEDGPWLDAHGDHLMDRIVNAYPDDLAQYDVEEFDEFARVVLQGVLSCVRKKLAAADNSSADDAPSEDEPRELLHDLRSRMARFSAEVLSTWLTETLVEIAKQNDWNSDDLLDDLSSQFLFRVMSTDAKSCFPEGTVLAVQVPLQHIQHAVQEAHNRVGGPRAIMR